MPDAPRAWSLDGRKKGEKAPATWQCPDCFAIQHPAKVCVACGYTVPAEEPDDSAAGRVVQTIDGELVEVNSERVDLLRSVPLAQLLSGARTDADLREIARARGFKPGWVWHIKQQRAARQVAA